MPIKLLVLGGRGIMGFGGGEKCRLYFYGRADFSDPMCSLHPRRSSFRSFEGVARALQLHPHQKALSHPHPGPPVGCCG